MEKFWEKLWIIFFWLTLIGCREEIHGGPGGGGAFLRGQVPPENPAPPNSNTTGNVRSSAPTGEGASLSPLSLNGGVRAIVQQPNGTVLIAGDFNTPHSIIRISGAGVVDSAFSAKVGLGANAPILSIALQADGKIVLGGEFTDFNGTAANRLLRLNLDGSVDSVFMQNAGTGFNDRVSSIMVQSDGKIAVGGNFTQFNGNSALHLVRLNGDGTQDTQFSLAISAPTPTPSVSASLSPKPSPSVAPSPSVSASLSPKPSPSATPSPSPSSTPTPSSGHAQGQGGGQGHGHDDNQGND